MQNLIQLVSQSSYWKMLLRGDTWREAGMSLRRAHKDRRARRHVLGLALMLIVPLFLLGYVGLLIGTGAIYAVPLVIPVLWWRARRAKQDEATMHIVPQAANHVRALSAEERAALLAYLRDLALFYAAMVSRAATEGFLKQKTLPEGFEVIARRRQLYLLREHGLWERMAARDRDAALLADGHWDWERINEAIVSLETVRLLRWALRLDFYLPVVGYQLHSDWSLAEELLQEPARLQQAGELIETDTVRTAKDAANTYFMRCLAEGISRGLYQADTSEAKAWADGVSESLAGRHSEDLVLGSTLVSEVEENDLRWATMVAARRKLFLEWMLQAMESGRTDGWEMSAFSPVQETEAEAAS